MLDDKKIKALGMRYIIRYEGRPHKGAFYLVRFSTGSARTGEKTILAQAAFSDQKLGGKNKALKLAIAWRNETAIRLNKIEQPHNLLGKFHTQPKSNTGVVGVYHCETVDRHGTYRNFFRVEWRETDAAGKRCPRAKIFSIGTTNAERVFRQAVRWRKQMEKLHYSGPFKNKRKSARNAK